jgi:protein-tyrosine kinase
MNLIEQAAKRLAELQRAGAETAHPAPGPAPDRTHTSSTFVAPIPEALVREVNASQRGIARLGPVGSGPVSPFAPPVANESPFTPVHKVEFDLERLRSLGFVTPDDLHSRIAHELRVIKRPILRNASGRGSKPIVNANRVMVTSALPGEGKTFTAANLALSMAMEFADAVLLVDGDVAHPALPHLLGVAPSAGFLDILASDDVRLEEVVLQTNVDRLMLLPAGSRHHRATELIASDRMDHFMATLAARLPGFIVVFDSPPLLPTSEARVLATHVGQIVMVVAADVTAHKAVEEALATVDRCECVMMVLNKAGASYTGSPYGYGYHSGDAAY